MTAEIAVMNKHGLALASDSAITISHAVGEKVFNSVNKLFTMSKYAPVGIMIYGDAEFMGVPWEPIIKMYRSELGTSRFGHIEEYASDLVRFISENPIFSDKDREARAFRYRVTQFLIGIRLRIDSELQALPYKGTAQATEQIRKAVNQTIKEEEEHFAKHRIAPASPRMRGQAWKGRVQGILREVFERFPLEDSQKGKMVALVETLFRSDYLPHTTGVVVAGFGEQEIYPKLVSMHLDGVYARKLRHTTQSQTIDESTTAALIPFAQSEMVATFMNGVDPSLARSLDHHLSLVLNQLPTDVISRKLGLNHSQHQELTNMLASLGKTVVEMCQKHSREYQRKHADPVTAALAHLPKEDLADLAESLVHLTSVKRRVALDTETVGGPIDVAVISKGDGFIWLKRKHYFRPELNPHFLATYYKRDSHDS